MKIAYLVDPSNVEFVCVRPAACRRRAAAAADAAGRARSSDMVRRQPRWPSAPSSHSEPLPRRAESAADRRLDPAGWSSSLIFPEHSAGNRQTQGPVWAPDGFHMAFVSEGRLWVVDVKRAARHRCADAYRRR